MKEFKVLGSGCAKCLATAKMIEDFAREKRVEITVEKVTDIAQIMGYGIMSTPGVVVDGKVVHAGGVPSKDKVASWL